MTQRLSASPSRPFRLATDYEISSAPLMSFSRAAKILARGTPQQVIPYLNRVPCGLEAVVLQAKKYQNFELIKGLEIEGLYSSKRIKEPLYPESKGPRVDHYDRRGFGPVYRIEEDS